MVLSFLLKQESRLFDDPGFRIKCGMTGLTVQLTEHDLKKQSQFISVQCSAFSGQRQDEEKEFEKTKPISDSQKGYKFLL